MAYSVTVLNAERIMLSSGNIYSCHFRAHRVYPFMLVQGPATLNRYIQTWCK
jgi:hypothetical protein